MSDMVFNDEPGVEVLQELAQGALKQNLLIAVRLWVWLRFLYGEERPLSQPFTYAQCRAAFFSNTHPQDDSTPTRHDPACPCGQTTRQLLFAGDDAFADRWCVSMQQHLQITPAKLQTWLNAYPFAVTRRSLAKDLKTLAALGWLNFSGRAYQYVRSRPRLPFSTPLVWSQSETRVLEQMPPDLATIQQNLASLSNGVTRFFFHVDYVVPKSATDAVDDWQDQLKAVWEQDVVPPVELSYRSARTRNAIAAVVYPVCAYYVRRAVYLCGFNPELEHDWYNYRLDKIQSLTCLDWSNERVPESLKVYAWNDRLPTPEYVEEQMTHAWGFDFYLPEQLLLLRFERDFHDAYVAGTVRHDTFQETSYDHTIALIQQNSTPEDAAILLPLLKARSRHDAYYQAQYRDRDINVIQRLRAWRPHMEVLFPLQLRQAMAAEVATEFSFYHAPS